jgi:hypothetical protein
MADIIVLVLSAPVTFAELLVNAGEMAVIAFHILLAMVSYQIKNGANALILLQKWQWWEVWKLEEWNILQNVTPLVMTLVLRHYGECMWCVLIQSISTTLHFLAIKLDLWL